MRQDPITDPPAVVREAESHEGLLIAAAGLDQRMACDFTEQAQMLARAKELCPHGQWEAALKKHGFKLRTVQWRLKKLEEAKAQKRKIALLEEVLEIADNPADSNGLSKPASVKPIQASSQNAYGEAGQLYCRKCRTTGVKSGCKACIAFRKSKVTLFTPNEPEMPADPLPADPTGDAAEDVPAAALVDADGQVLPEALRPAWECNAIEDWIEKYGRPAYAALKGLLGRPGTAQTNVDGIRKRQHAIANMLRSSKPKYRCFICKGERCKDCGETGWMSSARRADVQAMLEAKAAKEANNALPA
jgi:hypothetical protein